MSTRIDYHSGPISIRHETSTRPWVTIHHETRDDTETRATYWPGREDCGPYVSLSTSSSDGEATTFVTLEQAEAMRDALTIALDGAPK